MPATRITVGSTSHQARRLPSAGFRSRTLWLSRSNTSAPVSSTSQNTGAISTMIRHSSSTGAQAKSTKSALPSRLEVQAVSQARGTARNIRNTMGDASAWPRTVMDG